MFNIDFPVSLSDHEIRRIGLSRHLDMVAVDGFIDIVDPVAVKEIGDFHFLGRPQHFIADGDLLFPLGIHDLGAVFVQFTAHSGVAHLGDSAEKSLQVFFIQRCVKIGGKKEDQAVDQPRVLQDLAAQIIPHNKELFVSVHYVDPLRILHVQHSISR